MAWSINSVSMTHRIHRVFSPTYSIGWKFSKASRARNAQLYTNFIRCRALGDRKGEGWKIRWNYLAPRSPWIELFERSHPSEQRRFQVIVDVSRWLRSVRRWSMMMSAYIYIYIYIVVTLWSFFDPSIAVRSIHQRCETYRLDEKVSYDSSRV